MHGTGVNFNNLLNKDEWHPKHLQPFTEKQKDVARGVPSGTNGTVCTDP